MDEEAFRALFEATARPLRAYIRRVTGDAAAAEDVLQEAYLRVLRHPEAVAAPYLWRIATNLIRDRWRQARREREGLRRLASQPAPGPAAPAGDRVPRALSRLKPQARALLWLAHVEGRTHAEIGEILGLRAKSVRVLLFRARRAASRLLRQEGSKDECDSAVAKTTLS
jgi:RNA polymerase sigma-70 factor (ECF subfamily)